MILSRSDLPFTVSDEEWLRWVRWCEMHDVGSSVEVQQVYVACGTSRANAEVFLEFVIAQGVAKARVYAYHCAEHPAYDLEAPPAAPLYCPECEAGYADDDEKIPPEAWRTVRYARLTEKLETSPRKPTTLYIAGASSESRLIAGFAERLSRVGFVLPCPWWNVVEHAKSLGLTDTDLTLAEACAIAEEELAAVESCDLFWLVMPSKESRSAGCWTELGARLGKKLSVVASGPEQNRVFTSLVEERFATHEEAMAFFEAVTP